MARAKSTRKPSPAASEAPLGAERPASEIPAIAVTVAASLVELEEARKVALARGQAAAAVSATMAKAKLAGLLNEEAQAATPTAATAKMSLSEAARRIAYLLHLTKDDLEDDPTADKKP